MLRHSLLDQSAVHGLSSKNRLVTHMDIVVMIKRGWAKVSTSSALMPGVKPAPEMQFCVMPIVNRKAGKLLQIKGLSSLFVRFAFFCQVLVFQRKTCVPSKGFPKENLCPFKNFGKGYQVRKLVS